MVYNDMQWYAIESIQLYRIEYSVIEFYSIEWNWMISIVEKEMISDYKWNSIV